MFCLFDDMFLGFPIWVWLFIITVVLYIAHKKKKLPNQIGTVTDKVSQFVDNNTPAPIKKVLTKVATVANDVANDVATGVATGVEKVASVLPSAINDATSKVSKQAAAAFGYF